MREMQRVDISNIRRVILGQVEIKFVFWMCWDSGNGKAMLLINLVNYTHLHRMYSHLL